MEKHEMIHEPVHEPVHESGAQVMQPKTDLVQQETQPNPIPVQTVLVHAPTILPPNQWSRGICDCCGEFSICCYTCCCGWCAMIDVAKYAEKSCPCAWGCFCAFFYAFLRESLREMHNIPGSFAEDCVICIFCFSCMMCQMRHEIEYGAHKVTGF